MTINKNVHAWTLVPWAGVEPASINTPELSQATRLCQHDTPLYIVSIAEAV